MEIQEERLSGTGESAGSEQTILKMVEQGNSWKIDSYYHVGASGKYDGFLIQWSWFVLNDFIMIIRKSATLDRFEGKQAVLVLENGQELNILKEELQDVVEGEAYVIQIMPDKEATLEREALARTLLNQILQDEA